MLLDAFLKKYGAKSVTMLLLRSGLYTKNPLIINMAVDLENALEEYAAQDLTLTRPHVPLMPRFLLGSYGCFLRR